mmetsp:Transcript_16557/g.41330  ORF Transcript_16557/g.41330 Transcript_16557/m.41330 type:complete len:265 (+) Transcript_16557:1401-2195(+)
MLTGAGTAGMTMLHGLHDSSAMPRMTSCPLWMLTAPPKDSCVPRDRSPCVCTGSGALTSLHRRDPAVQSSVHKCSKNLSSADPHVPCILPVAPYWRSKSSIASAPGSVLMKSILSLRLRLCCLWLFPNPRSSEEPSKGSVMISSSGAVCISGGGIVMDACEFLAGVSWDWLPTDATIDFERLLSALLLDKLEQLLPPSGSGWMMAASTSGPRKLDSCTPLVTGTRPHSCSNPISICSYAASLCCLLLVTVAAALCTVNCWLAPR